MKSVDALRNELRSEVSGVDRLVRALGWFSVGLGTAELVTPSLIARLVGARPSLRTSLMLRVAGLRELGTGVAILMLPNHPLPIALRVAGDALDLGWLGLTALHPSTRRGRLAIAAAAVAGVTVLDAVAAVRRARRFDAATSPVVFSVTIARPAREVYDFFRKLERLPEFMDFLESVVPLDATHSRWTAKLPLAGTIAWEAELVDDRPGEAIVWKTMGRAFELEGRVTFASAPGRDRDRDREMTEVRVEMKLGVGGRPASALLARAFAKPFVKGDLRRLKQILETGEVLYSDASQHRRPHPARPAAQDERVKHTALPFIPTPPQAHKGAER